MFWLGRVLRHFFFRGRNWGPERRTVLSRSHSWRPFWAWACFLLPNITLPPRNSFKLMSQAASKTAGCFWACSDCSLLLGVVQINFSSMWRGSPPKLKGQELSERSRAKLAPLPSRPLHKLLISLSPALWPEPSTCPRVLKPLRTWILGP